MYSSDVNCVEIQTQLRDSFVINRKQSAIGQKDDNRSKTLHTYRTPDSVGECRPPCPVQDELHVATNFLNITNQSSNYSESL